MKRWSIAAALVIGAFWMGCGTEAGDRPQDCREDQYYNEARRQCLSCPAVVEPICRPGCGVEVISDQRGCPLMICEEACQGCEADQQWDPEEELCLPLDAGESSGDGEQEEEVEGDEE